jgi:Tol biopolymer transport system component
MTRHVPTAVAVLAATLLAVPAIRHIRERPPEPPPPPQPLRAIWSPGAEVEPGAGSDYLFGLALATDGRRLVYPAAKAGVVTLWLQDLRTGETRALPGTDQGVAPFWSVDGLRIGFFSGGQLRVLDLNAGTVATLADAASPRGATWNAAGDIVFAPAANGALMKRAVDGSIAPWTTLATPETGHVWPSFLDDERHVVFLVTSSDASRAGIWIAPLDAPQSRRRLMAGDAQPIVARFLQAPSPKSQAPAILYLNDQTLMAQQLDRETLNPSGPSTPVGLSVGRGPLGQLFATASGDVLIYGAPGTNLRELRWVAPNGDTVGRASEPVDAWDLRIAPDGRRVAITEVDPQLRTLDVFIREGSQPVATRLSLSTDIDESGVWSPDGLRIAWAGRRRHVMIRGAGAVLPEQTIASFDSPVQVWDWSRDGRSLLIGRTHADTRDDLWIQRPTEGAAAQPYVTTAFNQTFGVFSPDGRWVAYASDESGKFDIYIDSFPKPGSRLRVTTAGGTEPRWNRDGTELYFRRGSEVHAVILTRANVALEVSAMNRLFDAGAAVRSYDVSPDGRRFLINLPASSAARSPITIVHHWSAFAQTLRRDKSPDSPR